MQFTLSARRACRALVAAAALAVLAPAAHAAEVNVYSYRQPQLVTPILDRFTEETGIKVNTIFAGAGLVERMVAEGRNSPADLLMTVDIGRLTQAKEAGVSQPVKSAVLEEDIPAQYRDTENHWFALTMRARVVYASKERVPQDNITYEDLADPKWKGRVCTRSGQHVYTLGLISSMIVHHGEAETEKWLTGLKNNLARKPSGNDRSQVKNIFAGECDVALGNTYYMGLMQTDEKNPEQQTWAASAKIIFPNARGRGTHVNVSGMLMAKHAPHPKDTIKLMEFLASDEAQRLYAEGNHEYPVKPGVPASARVQSWGKLHPDPIALTEVAKQRAKASEMVDKVGFENGPSS